MQDLLDSARTLLHSPLLQACVAIVVAMFLGAFLWKILSSQEGFMFGYGNWVVGKWQAVRGTVVAQPVATANANVVVMPTQLSSSSSASPAGGAPEPSLHQERSVLTLSRVLDGDLAYLVVNHTHDWDAKVMQILETLVSGVTRVVHLAGQCRCGFFILDDEEKHLELVSGEGYAGMRRPRLDLEGSCAGRAFLTGEDYYCRDIETDPVYGHSIRGNRDFRSIACAPVRAGRVVYGVVCLDAEAADAFTQDDFFYLETFAAKLAVLCALHALQTAQAALVPKEEGD
jgi:putative methionine-R-sulfoxide reductase with GAF domain